MVLCPFWSGVPYEMMIVPTERQSHLQHASDDSLAAMGRAIRDTIAHLKGALGDISFNLGVHTAPHQHTVNTSGTSTCGRCSSPRPASSVARA